jgi:anti-sigma factor RsiW
MNINRHNYEEFFLLYVDNELTAAQRKIVEAFVAVNPDLQEEFQLIQDTKFDFHAALDDDFKTSMLKPVAEETPISDEQLLLYIDDELKAEEKHAIDEAAAKSYELQKELQLLKRTVAVADTNIVFPGKSLLYKEAQPARVFSMSSFARRWSAAAAIALLFGTGVWLLNRKSSTDSLAEGPVQPKTEQKVDQVIAPPVNTVKEAQQPVVSNNASQQQINTMPVREQKTVTAPVKKNNHHAVAKNNPVEQKEQKMVIDPQQKPEEIIAAIPNPLTESKKADISPNAGNKTNTPTVPPAETSIAKNTVTYVNNNDYESGSEDEEGLLNETRQRSSGLKSFFKKAKRTLERRTGIQPGDSQVRFAVFAVNTQ